jgi:hypothetical protein
MEEGKRGVLILSYFAGIGCCIAGAGSCIAHAATDDMVNLGESVDASFQCFDYSTCLYKEIPWNLYYRGLGEGIVPRQPMRPYM